VFWYCFNEVRSGMSLSRLTISDPWLQGDQSTCVTDHQCWFDGAAGCAFSLVPSPKIDLLCVHLCVCTCILIATHCEFSR